MELEELKAGWGELSRKAEGQHLSAIAIDQMTQRKYRKKVKGITNPEIAGIVICLAAAVFIGFNFSRLETPVFKVLGISTILLLSAISLLSFISIRELSVPANVNQPHVQTLEVFAARKLKFHRLQKISIFLGYLLLVAVIMLLPQIINGTDISGNPYFWMFSFSFGYLFLVYYSRFVSRYYRNSLDQAEELLKEVRTLRD